MSYCQSQCASEDIHDANKSWGIPFDGDSSVNFIIPEAGSWYVESAISFLHDDAVGYELEVFVDSGDILENLTKTKILRHRRFGWSRSVRH